MVMTFIRGQFFGMAYWSLVFVALVETKLATGKENLKKKWWRNKNRLQGLFKVDS